MSDKTHHALGSAMAERDAQERRVEQAKLACLRSVAARLPELVDMAAKRVARAQPSVTAGLGQPDLAAMRAELAEVAQTIGAELLGSPDAVDLPIPQGRWDAADRTSVLTAIAKVVHPHTQLIVSILTRHGYAMSNPKQGLRVRDLIDDADCESVATALNRLRAAEEAVLLARKAHEDATVDELWGD